MVAGGGQAPGGDGASILVGIDATIVIAHSAKENAALAWKKTFGFYALAAFADNGGGAGGEPLAIVLRPGNAGSNSAADQIATARLALAQLPSRQRRRALVGTERLAASQCRHLAGGLDPAILEIHRQQTPKPN